jgi:hypothetical protein
MARFVSGFHDVIQLSSVRSDLGARLEVPDVFLVGLDPDKATCMKAVLSGLLVMQLAICSGQVLQNQVWYYKTRELRHI